MSGINRMRTNAKWFTTVMMLIMLIMTGVIANPVHAKLGNITGTDIKSSNFAGTYNISEVTDTRGGAHTGIDLSAITQSMYWFGLYGEINKTVSLENGLSNIFYKWNVETPSGEIFATRQTSVDWANVQCADYDTVFAEQSITKHNHERVNLTFPTPNVQPFSVGTVDIGVGICNYASYLLDGTGLPGTYEEVLLESNNNIIYTSIVSAGGTSFTGKTADYQMLLPEDGTDDSTTTYYLYAEIE